MQLISYREGSEVPARQSVPPVLSAKTLEDHVDQMHAYA